MTTKMSSTATNTTTNNKKPKLTKVERLAKTTKNEKNEAEEDLFYEEVGNKTEVKQRTEELSYKRLQLQQQILLRPDTYIGSVKRVRSIDPIWVLSGDKIVQRNVAFTEGYIRLFIEVISNAIDNVWRSQEFKIPAKIIKINIDRENNTLSVWNDGKAIPLNVHPEEKIYIPELIFGNLLTSSNYNDNEERKTSGKNGYGVKLCNIFSQSFEIECFNPEYGIYSQKWEKNMEIRGEGKLDKTKSKFPKSAEEGKTGYTCITWKPELSRFDMKELDKETLSVIEKYIVDTAMTVCPYRVKVFYNDKEIVMNDHKDYVKYYFKGELPEETLVLSGKDTNAIVCPYSEFTQISFVNGINTKDGGVHVDAWCEALFRPVVNKLNGVKDETKTKEEEKKKGKVKGKKEPVKKEKNMNVDIRDIKKNFFIFVFASLDKPQFDNQSKTRLNSPAPAVEVKSAAISKLLKWRFVELIKETQKLKEMFGLKNETERKRGFIRVEGLDDANNAGKAGKNQQCILCITEGLSAKTFVVQGMKYGIQGVSGRDFIGVLPIRGKFLNARGASVNILKKNKEVKAIIQSLGLQYDTDYTIDENRKRLRYGKLCIATDADDDGLHITGLLYNFFSALFPTLLKVEGFFYFMRTPILKVKQGKTTKSFYFQSEAKKYIEKNDIKKNAIKYYKGLGTSNANDVKEDFGRRIVELKTDDEGDALVDNIFSKDKGKSDFRKNWLTTFDPEFEMKSNTVKDYEVEQLHIKNFINYELINFSIEDCKRSIPCISDGFKDSHRKVIYAAFKRNLRYSGEALKVAQFAGYVAEHSNYHHGETILYDTITRLAQRFVGSNNIPLLFNDGQFGSRLEMGKDAANGRYIHTKLDMLTRLIYREEDEAFLPDREDDGILVEKQHYVPIVPMILVNGCNTGIGTGWSCSVPAYNITDIINWIRLWINETENDSNNPDQLIIVDKPTLTPWYRNFKGSISTDGKKVITKGIVKREGNNYVITELPIGKKNLGIAKYKEKLEEMKEKGIIKSIKDHSTEDEPKFTITLDTDEIGDIEGDKLLDKLNLIDYLYTSNMVLFDSEGKLKKYSNINNILEEFCEERFKLYKTRKDGIIKSMEDELKYTRNKAKFVKEIVDKKLVLNDKDDDMINEELKKRGYDKKISEEKSSYEYLLSMQMRSMTKSKLESLDKEIKDLETRLDNYKKTTTYNMWRNELKELEDKYKEWIKKN